MSEPGQWVNICRARLRSRNERGQSLVEFALCLPLLMLLVTGMITFGIALHDYLEMTDAVSVGARLVAISRGQTTDPCATSATAVYNAAPLLKRAKRTSHVCPQWDHVPWRVVQLPHYHHGARGNLVQGADRPGNLQYPYNLKVFGTNYRPAVPWRRKQRSSYNEPAP